MEAWGQGVVAVIGRWRLERRIHRESMRIAGEIYPALWESVRRKIASVSRQELAAYAKIRAAQLTQEKVDALMQENVTLTGEFAARLLLLSTEQAARQALAAAASLRRPAA